MIELTFEVEAAEGGVLTLSAAAPPDREILGVALSIQVMIDPARRAYDDGARARLYELFGTPERWGVTTHSMPWARVDVQVPAFAGETTFPVSLPASEDPDTGVAKYLDALHDGDVPLTLFLTGRVGYRADDGRAQIAPIPWDTVVRSSMPLAVR